MRKMMLGLGVIGLMTATLAFTGCASPTSPDGVRANFSPELHSMTRSFEQHRNMEARTIDMNGRAIWDDGARMLLLDRPTRLTPYPTP